MNHEKAEAEKKPVPQADSQGNAAAHRRRARREPAHPPLPDLHEQGRHRPGDRPAGRAVQPEDENARFPPGQGPGRRGEKSAQAGPARRGHPAGRQQAGLRPHRTGQDRHRRRALRGKDGRPRRGGFPGRHRRRNPARDRTARPGEAARGDPRRRPEGRSLRRSPPGRHDPGSQQEVAAGHRTGPSPKATWCCCWCNPRTAPARENGRARKPIS